MRNFALASVMLCALVGCNRDSAKEGAPSKEGANGVAQTDADPLVGKPAPDFTAKAQTGAEVHLAALKGKPVVVYFYPKDETSGCTAEANAFRDTWSDLQKKDVVLIGVSGDTDESHRAFADNHKLPFLLVSDPDGKIAAKFGVPFKGGYASRQSFVIGPDGNVTKVYRAVDVTAHAKQIGDDVTAAKKP